MKTLMKLAAKANKQCPALYNRIIFDGDVARATDCDIHAVTHGPWNFDRATVVDVTQIKMALAINPKNPVWAGDTLNGVKLVSVADAASFPELPFNEFGNGTRIDCGNLAAIVGQTLPAAADNDIRYYLNGLFFDHDNRRIAGCDGHRLHVVTDAYASALTGQSIVPRAAFDLVGVKNVLHMDFAVQYFRLGYCGGYLVGKLIDGKYPDIDRVLPAASARPNVVAFNAAQTAAVKSLVSVIKARKTKFGALAINADGSIEAYDIRLPCFASFAMTQLEGQKYKSNGEYHGPKQYGINAAYLHDAMLAADHGTIAADTVNDSLLITNGAFRAVVMPCRL